MKLDIVMSTRLKLFHFGETLCNGFTGHEHLSELGIIHMNGRLYDPVLGRFLQADPIIQAPHNAQSHNRYSYVLNNPLSFTDPSGFSAWTKWRKPVIGLVAGVLTGGLAAGYMSVFGIINGGTVFASASGGLTALGAATAAAAGGFAAGGINGGNIQSALRGAFTAALTAGILQGIEGLANGAGGAEGGLAAPSPAIDYLRNADGTATSFAGPASLGDWYPNAQGQFEVIGSRTVASGALQPGGMGAVLGDLFTMSIPGLSFGSCVASGCSGWGWFGGAVGSLPLLGAAIRPAAPLATAAPAMTEGLVYRAATGTPKSMTARPGDLNGLSASNSLQTALPGKNQIIDVSKLNSLCARCDNIGTGHVSIMPKDVTQLEGWMASRLTGQMHPLTRELMDAVVGTVKK